MTPLVHVAGTDPYPWPYDGKLDAPHTALVVCGAQPALAAASHGAGTVLAALSGLAGALRAGSGRVIWVRHGTRSTGNGRPSPLPVRGSDGWGLLASPSGADLVVDAAGWDGSFGSDLDDALRRAGVRTLLLGGLAAELTVDSTVRTLNDRGWECLVLTDGCAPCDPTLGARAHHSLTMSGGIFGALGTIAGVAAALALDTTSTNAKEAP